MEYPSPVFQVKISELQYNIYPKRSWRILAQTINGANLATFLCLINSFRSELQYNIYPKRSWRILAHTINGANLATLHKQ